MTLCRISYIVLVIFIAAISCRAQDGISVGVKGGVPLTDPFADRSVQQIIATIPSPFGPPQIISQTARFSNGSRNFVLGPTLELRLPLGLAIEANALYRPMEFQIRQTTSLPLSATSITLVNRVDAWELPVLGKYRLPLPVVKPYVAAGPSFRATAALLAKHMSGTGISTGIGIETRLGPLLIAPEVRYTHWGADGTYPSPYYVKSEQNQVEFLVGLATRSGLSKATALSVAGWRRSVAVGVKGGWPFANAFIADSYSRITYPALSCGDFSLKLATCTPYEATVETHRASRYYLVGPSVEVHLPLHLSVEGDALYSPLSLAPPPSQFFLPAIQTYVSWSFPVVGKYRFRLPFAQPYLEIGPTFRTASSPINHYLSKEGVTAGVGVEATVWKVRLSPEARYVRWGADTPDAGVYYASRRNQAQFLLGLYY
jgi:hypothetical protein